MSEPVDKERVKLTPEHVDESNVKVKVDLSELIARAGYENNNVQHGEDQKIVECGVLAERLAREYYYGYRVAYDAEN